MNAHLLSVEGWTPFLKTVAESNTPILITETHDYATLISRATLVKAGATVTECFLNPFRAPARLFAPENHFISFCNGYFYAVGV
jgi:hypothetical protein